MKNKLKKLKVALVLGFMFASLTPVTLVFAQTGTVSGGGAAICQLLPGRTLAGLLDYTSCIIGSSIVGIIFALAFAYFFWGVVQYVLYPDEESKKDKGRSMMITGIIALTVMFSVYGLINIVVRTFGFDSDNAALPIPQVPQQ